MNTDPKLRKSRRLLTVYIAAIILVCALFTYGVSSHLVETRERLGTWTPGAICRDVLSGDRILLVDESGTTNLVQVLGIEAPPVASGQALTDFARRVGRREDFVLQQGQTAHSTLRVWINRRHVKTTVPEGFETAEANGAILAYASRQGVDIGRKMLQGGQAVALDIPHPRLEEYRQYEAEAQAAGAGLWRAP
jgi:endonuclease YncB( thermonuclease family)